MYKKNIICCNIPNKVYLAFSSGSDSTAILDFLLKGQKEVHLLHFNHLTKNSNLYESHAVKLAKSLNLKISIGHSKPVPKGSSKEDWWRKSRYDFFKSFNEFPIVLGHHLEDQIETYIFGMIHGNKKLMKCQVENIIRPFLCFEKHKLMSLNKSNYLIDESNFDMSHPRNRIRHSILPEIKKINPGIYKNIIKLMNEDEENEKK